MYASSSIAPGKLGDLGGGLGISSFSWTEDKGGPMTVLSHFWGDGHVPGEAAELRGGIKGMKPDFQAAPSSLPQAPQCFTEVHGKKSRTHPNLSSALQ